MDPISLTLIALSWVLLIVLGVVSVAELSRGDRRHADTTTWEG